MAKSREREISFLSEQEKPRKAILFELKGRKDTDDGSAATMCTEMVAALSVEEVIAYVRARPTNVEIMELKVLGKVQVLSSSENLT